MNKICNFLIIIFMFLGLFYLTGIAFFQIVSPTLTLNSSYIGFIAPLMLVFVLLIYLQISNQLHKIIAQLFIIYIALSLAMIDIIILYAKIGLFDLNSFINGTLFFAILGISFHMIKQSFLSGEKKPE